LIELKAHPNVEAAWRIEDDSLVISVTVKIEPPSQSTAPETPTVSRVLPIGTSAIVPGLSIDLPV
jgi:hypothetical protein